MKLCGRKIPLIYLNLGAFILGGLAGLALYKFGICHGEAAGKIITAISPFGNILVKLLKMIVIPIIFFSLICGAATMPAKSFGKMGAGVCAWYLFTSLYAAVFGTLMALLFNPSLPKGEQMASGMMQQLDSMMNSGAAEGNAFVNIFYSLFDNPFHALAEGNFLPVIVFAIMFGLAARVVLDTTDNSRTRESLLAMLNVLTGCQSAIFKMIEWVMHYFPIGIFALTTCSFAVYGIKLFGSYLQVAACVICGILLMIALCYPLLIWLICRVNPFPVIWALREPILTAFVTRSSAATLPVSLKTAQEKFRIRQELSSFSLSLGATINMDGVCIHLPVFAVLAANMFGFELSLAQILLLVLSVVFASIGTGGVPGGSTFLLFMVLSAVNLDPVQTATIVALALGINPLLDMFETACNVAGDNVGNYVIGSKMKLRDK